MGHKRPKQGLNTSCSCRNFEQNVFRLALLRYRSPNVVRIALLVIVGVR